jgi:3-deoxy-D-manno-octulosonate 8-phosphate phosphatase (KDO 8-P phosphatase)
MPTDFPDIRCLSLDVDGVMTDGGIYWDDAGHNLRRFDVQDGFVLRWFQKLGGIVVICSGKSSEAVTRRARELHVDHLIQGTPDKVASVGAVLRKAGLDFANLAAIGDDLPDVPLLKRCGLPIAVANAAPEVKAVARLVTTRPGGHGAIREAVEHILKGSGRWAEVLAHYYDIESWPGSPSTARE